MTTYHIWADHVGGKSVSHPCRDGTYDDPADIFQTTIDSEDEGHAALAAKVELEKIVSDAEPCKCGKSNRMHYDDWWDSVWITASRTPHPKYTGDPE